MDISYHSPKKGRGSRGANIRWRIVSVKKIIFVSHCSKVFLKYIEQQKYMYVRCTHPQAPLFRFLPPLHFFAPMRVDVHIRTFSAQIVSDPRSLFCRLSCRMVLFLSFAYYVAQNYVPSPSANDKKSFPLHHYKFQAKKIIEHIRIFYTFLIPFTNNFSSYFKCYIIDTFCQGSLCSPDLSR